MLPANKPGQFSVSATFGDNKYLIKLFCISEIKSMQ